MLAPPPNRTSPPPTSRARSLALALAGAVVVVLTPAAAAADDDLLSGNRLRIEVLSSRADQVSGGDALVRVSLGYRVDADDVRVTLNGADVTDALDPRPGRSLAHRRGRRIAVTARTNSGRAPTERTGRPADPAQPPDRGSDLLRAQAVPVPLSHRAGGPGPAHRGQPGRTGSARLRARRRGQQDDPGDRMEPRLRGRHRRRPALPRDRRRVQGDACRRLPAGRHDDDHHTGRSHARLRHQARTRHDQPVHLLDRHPRRRDGLEPADHLPVRRRRGDRPRPGSPARGRALPRGPVAGVRDPLLDRDAHEHALQPRARRRDGADAQGALRRGPRRAAVHGGCRRIRWGDPAVRLRPEPPRAHRRGHSPVLVPRHGHPDDPRRRLRTARVLHGRHRRRQPEVAELGEPDLAHRPERQCHGAQPVPRRRSGLDRVRPRLAGPDPAGPEPELPGSRSTVGNHGSTRGHAAGQMDALGRPRDHLRRRTRRVRPQRLGQRRRAVRPRRAPRPDTSRRRSSWT